MELNKIFGAVLREYRDERGLSQEKLAELSELERTFISFLERGERQPSLTTIFKIAKALDISATQLVSSVEARIQAEQKAK